VWRNQVNKNWLAKVLVGTDAMVAALAFKAWWQPSFTVAANAGAARGRRVRLNLFASRRVSSVCWLVESIALVTKHCALPAD
jgi:hypothetical protein